MRIHTEYLLTPYSDLHPLDNAHAERTKKAEIFRRLPLNS